ncbi:MAG: DUF421 domain-containing protein [Micrococcales bacterium]|nr:DUF421 domain-containing protein [Micrococcales bacterium]
MEDAFWDYISLTGWQVLALVVSTSVLFWFFSFLMRVFRSRLQLRVSVSSLALMTLVGAVTARSMLGDRPTLAAGVVCLGVMLGWEAVFRAWRRWRRQPPRPARAVVVDGRADPDAVRQVGITESDLWVRLRRAGVLRRTDVRVAIVETDGTLTVIRPGQPVDPELLADVVGLPDSIRQGS